MKDLENIKWCLGLVINILSGNDDSHNADDVKWCLDMVERFGYYDPEWSQYSIVKCYSHMARRYRECLQQASSCKGSDSVMYKNWHIMANNYCQDMKRISVLL